MREELLNQKLKSLQTYIDQAREISDNGWLVRSFRHFQHAQDLI